MNFTARMKNLILRGDWSFFADGVLFTRKNLSIKARLNLLLQLLSKQLRLPFTLGVPYSLTVEPASVCNLVCSTCPAGLNRKMCSPPLLRLEDFKKTIDMIGDYLTFIQLWSWGEPFLNPKLAEMIAYAKKKGIIIISSTNGHFLNNEATLTKLVHSGLDELILAVDGTTQEVYEQFRQGGNLDKVLEGIKNIVRIRNREGSTTPRLHMRMVINPFNEDQKDDFAALALSLGVDVVSYKKIDIGMGGLTGNNSLLPKNKDYVIKCTYGAIPYKCVAFWGFPVLSSSGNIGLCSLDSQRETDLIHISYINSFRRTWNSAKARYYRRAMKKNPNAFQFCQECICREPDFKNAYFDVTILKQADKEDH